MGKNMEKAGNDHCVTSRGNVTERGNHMINSKNLLLYYTVKGIV